MAGMLCRMWRCARAGEGRAGRPTQPVASEGKKSNPSDDLTVIHGVGIAAQNRLNAAGIKSYAQLARAAPEDVRRILGKLASGTRVEEWIAQARDLAQTG